MKKSISILLCFVLIFSSFSFAFAQVSDSQATQIVNDLSTIKTTLSNIYTRLGTIQGYLFDSNHSIAYWVSAIDSWMQPIYQSLTSNLATNLGLEPIISGLNEIVSVSGGGTTYYPYLYYNGKSNARWLSDLYTYLNQSGMTSLLQSNGTYTLYIPTAAGGLTTLSLGGMGNRPWFNNTNQFLNELLTNTVRIYSYEFNHRDNGYNSTQSLVSFADPDSTVTFTPLSSIDGLYKYLNAINTPLARLGYVLASDSRIEAQEAAAANEQAVVDNFIDPNGSGSASTSDFDSVADFSSGYQSTFSSDASPTGIFNLFTSDNMSWFSQETYNQLDTTSNNRAKSDNTFNTPLLDEQINSIYQQLGVKQP